MFSRYYRRFDTGFLPMVWYMMKEGNNPILKLSQAMEQMPRFKGLWNKTSVFSLPIKHLTKKPLFRNQRQTVKHSWSREGTSFNAKEDFNVSIIGNWRSDGR